MERATGNACPLDHKTREQAPAFDRRLDCGPSDFRTGVYGDTVASIRALQMRDLLCILLNITKGKENRKEESYIAMYLLTGIKENKMDIEILLWDSQGHIPKSLVLNNKKEYRISV